MGTTGQSITLANSIIGVGILAMPFCFQQCGVLLATLILIFMGLVSRLCCYFLLKSALIARRRNFEFLAFHVFGSAGKFAVEVGIIGFLMGTCIAYFVVVGDLGPQIVSKMFNINQSDMLRTSIMVIVSLVCVLPLGLLRNVDSLSNVSAATIGFYFCLVMKVITEAATQLLTVDWQSRVEMWKPSGVLQCVPIFSMALFCQTQLFEIFESLPSLSMEKMNLVTKNAINICTGVYFTLGLFGYIAFNSQEISGNILMSLSPTMANDVIKLGFVMSLAFSFPLIIFPCRASLYSLLYKKVHSSHHDHIINHSIPESSFRRITVCIVALTLGVSLLLPNIELVLGLVGSTIGVLVCLVFPASCFVSLTFKNTNERVLAKGIVVFGLIIMILGTYANLQAAEVQMDKYDEKYITKEKIDKIVEDFFEKREKIDGVISEIRSKVDTDNNKNEIIKESVVLPPNPVPPESQSNEKHEAEMKNAPNLKQILPQLNEVVDKVSESHPKNLNKLNDPKLANEVKKPDESEKTKSEIKPQSNEEKLNIIKQQQLIETIKQHGEEQKELIKEQKEILHEIKKTKQEFEKNKNDANDEAKKIAVESIKQIANIALKSLVGVSDKPGQVAADKKTGGLEKLADEAVQEIAQKAVETIEAIKEIKEKPAQPDIKLDNLPKVPVSPDTQPLNNIIQVQNSNIAPPDNQNNQANNVPNLNNYNNQVPDLNNAILNKPNIQANIKNPQDPLNSNSNPRVQNDENPNLNANSHNAYSNVKSFDTPQDNVPVAQFVEPIVEANIMENDQNLENNGQKSVNIGQDVEINQPDEKEMNIVKPAIVEPSVNAHQPAIVAPPNHQPVVDPQNVPTDIHANPVESNSNKEQPETKVNLQDPKLRIHTPELQSYKQEDSRIKSNIETKLNEAIVQNIPLALALNSNTQVNNQQINSNIQEMNKNIVLNDGVQTNINNEKKDNLVHERQKREVVDCTEMSSLKSEDKEICNTLINPISPIKMKLNNADVNDILPKVDLGHVNLPLDPNILHHISRSLKSADDYNNNDKKR